MPMPRASEGSSTCRVRGLEIYVRLAEKRASAGKQTVLFPGREQPANGKHGCTRPLREPSSVRPISTSPWLRHRRRVPRYVILRSLNSKGAGRMPLGYVFLTRQPKYRSHDQCVGDE